MKKLLLISLVGTFLFASQAFWNDENNDDHYTSIVPSDKYAGMSLVCSRKKGDYETKLVVEMEHPCFDVDEDIEVEKIDSNKVAVYDHHSMVIAFSLASDPDKSGKQIIGKPGCKLKGREKWTLYYRTKGSKNWKKGCETTWTWK